MPMGDGNFNDAVPQSQLSVRWGLPDIFTCHPKYHIAHITAKQATLNPLDNYLDSALQCASSNKYMPHIARNVHVLVNIPTSGSRHHSPIITVPTPGVENDPHRTNSGS